MDVVQMRERCRDAVRVDVARLPAYKFIINSRGVATIIPDESCEVYGVLWSISTNDESSLDYYEGVGNSLYDKQVVSVYGSTSGVQEALAYVARDTAPGCARDSYIENIICAAQQHRLPDRYIEGLSEWLKTGAQDL